MAAKTEMEKLRNLEIDKTNIDEELCTQASNFLFCAEKAVEFEARYMAIKMTHEILCARLDGEIRGQFEKDGKKVTEAVVSNALLLNEEYQNSRKSLNASTTQKDVLRAMRDGWAMRKDLLLRVAINQRAEIMGFESETVKEAA